MNGVTRVTVRRSAEEWSAIMSRFERSGLTTGAFCASESLAPSTFSLWRRKLRRSAEGSGANGAARFDVLQRIDRHPAKRVIELTPRVWKELFAENPLRSDLDRVRDPPPRSLGDESPERSRLPAYTKHAL